MAISVQADRSARHIGNWELGLQIPKKPLPDYGECATDIERPGHAAGYSHNWPQLGRMMRAGSSQRSRPGYRAGSGSAALDAGENSGARNPIRTLQLRGHPISPREGPIVDVPDDGTAVDME